MKKESFGNSRKCLGQKNLDTSGFEIPEISLAQLILEQFVVNKERTKYYQILYMETKETELVQLIRQLKDYVILDKKRLRKARTEQ